MFVSSTCRAYQCLWHTGSGPKMEHTINSEVLSSLTYSDLCRQVGLRDNLAVRINCQRQHCVEDCCNWGMQNVSKHNLTLQRVSQPFSANAFDLHATPSVLASVFTSILALLALDSDGDEPRPQAVVEVGIPQFDNPYQFTEDWKAEPNK